MSHPEPTGSRLRDLLNEWDAEVQEHGLWTSGHTIAARIVAVLRASVPSAEPKVASWGFIAQNQVVDDGCGEVDSCPACAAAPVPSAERPYTSDTPCTVAHPHQVAAYQYLCAVCGKLIVPAASASTREQQKDHESRSPDGDGRIGTRNKPQNVAVSGHVAADNSEAGEAAMTSRAGSEPADSLTASTREPGWQPIETAPKDGTEIIILVGENAPWIVVGAAYWTDRLEYMDGRVEGARWTWSGTGNKSGGVNITPRGWMPMPLPAPPVARAPEPQETKKD